MNDMTSGRSETGFWAGIHPGMGIASKAMIFVFVFSRRLMLNLPVRYTPPCAVGWRRHSTGIILPR